MWDVFTRGREGVKGCQCWHLSSVQAASNCCRQESCHDGGSGSIPETNSHLLVAFGSAMWHECQKNRSAFFICSWKKFHTEAFFGQTECWNDKTLTMLVDLFIARKHYHRLIFDFLVDFSAVFSLPKEKKQKGNKTVPFSSLQLNRRQKGGDVKRWRQGEGSTYTIKHFNRFKLTVSLHAQCDWSVKQSNSATMLPQAPWILIIFVLFNKLSHNEYFHMTSLVHAIHDISDLANRKQTQPLNWAVKQVQLLFQFGLLKKNMALISNYTNFPLKQSISWKQTTTLWRLTEEESINIRILGFSKKINLREINSACIWF